VSKSDVGNAVIVCSKMTITVDLGTDQVVIEEIAVIAEGETVEKSLHVIDLNGRTGPAEVIDRIASIVLIKSNAPIAWRKAIALSGRIDLSVLIVPAVGEIIECYVLSSSQETLKE
jgi:hypothetical protein